MSTWDAGPFGNDDAADFAIDLDDAPAEDRAEMVGAALERVVEATDDDLHLGIDLNLMHAVAAAALVVAQCSGGGPLRTGPGPMSPMPRFPVSFRELALKTLDRVVAPPSWLAEFWDESGDGPAWRRTVADLRRVLDPPQREQLFAL